MMVSARGRAARPARAPDRQHGAAFPVTFWLEIEAFLRRSFQQLSRTPEYEAACAISHRRACHSMFFVHITAVQGLFELIEDVDRTGWSLQIVAAEI
ncbi:hypothetical protein QQF64_015696 [Cirrhinus molitorella]|uniref:Uncharacterized protein n=1 Tax=Cirrhinus molitorella TaxID=172907 RepID=A0ABR3NVQ8_9TELE